MIDIAAALIFGVDRGLANDAGLAGGARIGYMAGEVDGGARLAACRWLQPGPAWGGQQITRELAGRSSAR